MFKKNLKLVLLFSLLATNKLFGAKLILSNSNNTQSSFNFNINAHNFLIPLQQFFVAADEPVPLNNFAISAASQKNQTFRGLTPPFVTLNNRKSRINPLTGAKITHLTKTSYKPVATKEGDSAIYIIDEYFATPDINVFSSENLNDSNGIEAHQILALESDNAEITKMPETVMQDSFIFAAVSNPTGSFDGNGSGLAIAQLQAIRDAQGKVTFRFENFNAQTGDSGNLAYPIDKSTDAIKINSDVAAIGNMVDMHFDKSLNRLYVALNVESNTGSNDGARAVFIAGLAGNRLVSMPITPNSVIASNNQIVGALGASEQIQIHRVRTMLTTTHLNYLIVVGNNGTNTAQNVFALPLVNNTEGPFHGELANVNAQPATFFLNGDPAKFLKRSFIIPAENPDDVYTNQSPQAIVGSNSVLPSNITDINVVGDSVFVSVVDSGNGETPGIFYSQALFDNLGRIIAWTPWKKSLTGPIQGFALDPICGNFWFIPNKAGTTNDVFKTQWSEGQSELEKFVQRQFCTAAGVIGLFDFPLNKPGFSQTLGSRLSVVALTSTDKVLLLQSGKDNNNSIFGPELLNSELKFLNSTDGSLTQFEKSATSIAISGGELNKIGFITSADIISDGTNGWLVVGGSAGLAILAKPDGSGWNATVGLERDFVGLTNDMSFKILGNYKNIKKVVAIDNRLYVLTNNMLDRIEITSASIEFNQINNINIAHAQEGPFTSTDFFSDVIISEPLGTLATSNGLFTTPSTSNIATAIHHNDILWQVVSLPEVAGTFCGFGPVSRLLAISPNGFETGVSKNGNIYALNGYVGYNEAQVYRFFVNQNNGASSNALLLFPDMFILNKPTFYINLEDYRNYFITDGAINAISRSSYAGSSPKLWLLNYPLRSGQRFAAKNPTLLDLSIQQCKSIGRLTRDSASGSWLIYGDFGIRINQ